MDVDCCIWDTEGMDRKTPMNHIATFDGVGYIHGKSSKFMKTYDFLTKSL